VSWKRPFGCEADDIYFRNIDTLPVIQITWNDASAYCRWLSGITGKQFRLPLESEWEVFAEKSGVPGIESFSNMPDIRAIRSDTPEDFVSRLIDRVKNNSGYSPSGLLWEWCADWFDAYPGGRRDKDFGTVYRVLRGGSLQSHPVQRSRQYRFRRCPTARSPFYGFRTALSE
jgi:formylglycine-generating enzyme required for sulfatase activity